ncbi:hypothetical protein N0V88_006673 [Collariella sp. IMI 366227]|nr:hypothetical protein N0V88_006673 [Collariella sp. IMI 366227]
MRDPFPIPPIPALSKAVEPLAERLAMPTLPLHIHEVVGAAVFYTFIQVVVSPVLSDRFFSKYYPRHSRSKKANWDTHVVSLIQSLIINALALWIMYADDERKAMNYEQRVWGYTGASGLVQALAAGYFVWDLGVTLLNLDIFGLGLLAHAVSALAVYTFGFLSTPFLNIHWFCDKLNMTGSRVQLYNGVALLATFFLCRLVWGTYQSGVVYVDMWHSLTTPPSPDYLAKLSNTTITAHSVNNADTNPMFFVSGNTPAPPVPLWLTLLYLSSNLVLNGLNWYWFVKMVAAVRKRFVPPVEGAGKGREKVPVGERAAGKEEIRQRLRRHSIEDVVPDSEELREGLFSRVGVDW